MNTTASISTTTRNGVQTVSTIRSSTRILTSTPGTSTPGTSTSTPGTSTPGTSTPGTSTSTILTGKELPIEIIIPCVLGGAILVIVVIILIIVCYRKHKEKKNKVPKTLPEIRYPVFGVAEESNTQVVSNETNVDEVRSRDHNRPTSRDSVVSSSSDRSGYFVPPYIPQESKHDSMYIDMSSPAPKPCMSSPNGYVNVPGSQKKADAVNDQREPSAIYQNTDPDIINPSVEYCNINSDGGSNVVITKNTQEVLTSSDITQEVLTSRDIQPDYQNAPDKQQQNKSSHKSSPKTTKNVSNSLLNTTAGSDTPDVYEKKDSLKKIPIFPAATINSSPNLSLTSFDDQDSVSTSSDVREDYENVPLTSQHLQNKTSQKPSPKTRKRAIFACSGTPTNSSPNPSPRTIHKVEALSANSDTAQDYENAPDKSSVKPGRKVSPTVALMPPSKTTINPSNHSINQLANIDVKSMLKPIPKSSPNFSPKSSPNFSPKSSPNFSPKSSPNFSPKSSPKPPPPAAKPCLKKFHDVCHNTEKDPSNFSPKIQKAISSENPEKRKGVKVML